MWHSSARTASTRHKLAHPLATAEDLGGVRSWLTNRRLDRAIWAADSSLPTSKLRCPRIARPLTGGGVTDVEARRAACASPRALRHRLAGIGETLTATALIGV